MKKLNVFLVLLLMCGSLYGADSKGGIGQNKQLSRQEAEERYPDQDLIWTKEKRWIRVKDDTRTPAERTKEERDLNNEVSNAVNCNQGRIYQERMETLRNGVNSVFTVCTTASRYVLNKVGVVDRQNASGVPVPREEDK